MKRTLLHFAEKLKKPLHIFTAFAVIICTAFIVPSYAGENIDNKVIKLDNSITVARDDRSSSPYLKYLNGTGDNFLCVINTNYVVLTNEQTSTVYFGWGKTDYNPASSGVQNVVNNDYGLSDYGLYRYAMFGYNSSQDLTGLTPFSDYVSAAEYISDYIDNDNNNVSYDFETTVEVPSGSVAYIGIPSSGSLSLSAKTSMPMYTSIGSNTWSNVPQRVKQVSSLPDSTTTFPLSGSAIPNWTKTEPYNWLNQSKSAVTSTTSWSGSNGNFLTFYNPVYYMDGSIQASTNTVYLTISGYSSIRIYPLQNDMSITAGSTSTSPTDYDGYWDATITDNGDGTGSVSYNPSEGSSLPPTPTSNQYNTGTSSSIIDYINQINQTLTNFAESFINLLKAPVAHIQQLVSAGSDFVGQLSGLYSWLPAEVYNTLTSAIILCISVGVLKVLL